LQRFVLCLVDLERGVTIRARGPGRAKVQDRPQCEERSGGTLPGQLLAITLEHRQGLPLGVAGVFFRSCSWKNRPMLSGATDRPRCSWRWAAICSKLRAGFLIYSTSTKTAACVPNPVVGAGGCWSRACSRSEERRVGKGCGARCG